MTKTSSGSGEPLVRAFLAAMEARDLDTARSFLADSFVMAFPGSPPFHTLEDLIAWSKPRYKSVGKTYDRFDEVPENAAGESIVYCFGHLHGEWLDGRPFADIRFIDRFAIRDGKLVDQKVWNDMGEVRLGEVRLDEARSADAAG